MPDDETIFEWVKKACNLHPDTQDMDAIHFGEFKYIVRCAVHYAQKRKPLTNEQIRKASLEAGMQEHYMGFHSGFISFARAIEAVHNIKD